VQSDVASLSSSVSTNTSSIASLSTSTSTGLSSLSSSTSTDFDERVEHHVAQHLDLDGSEHGAVERG
jgi:hypothetical protein